MKMTISQNIFCVFFFLYHLFHVYYTHTHLIYLHVFRRLCNNYKYRNIQLFSFRLLNLVELVGRFFADSRLMLLYLPFISNCIYEKVGWICIFFYQTHTHIRNTVAVNSSTRELFKYLTSDFKRRRKKHRK